MTTTTQSRLFGSRRRTEVLVTIALLGETFPAELARLLGAPLYSVQNIVSALDREGVLASRISGRARIVSLDPRYFACKELKAVLLRLAEAEPELRAIASSRRSRPRRAGKPL
ncbi:MAG TPA: hypothetical protein VFX92_08640 [Candidatus Krumholzibacteria bacterium]|nr:hypothetical protein [Candidatus Krumholzibacteria bacterium]